MRLTLPPAFCDECCIEWGIGDDLYDRDFPNRCPSCGEELWFSRTVRFVLWVWSHDRLREWWRFGPDEDSCLRLWPYSVGLVLDRVPLLRPSRGEWFGRGDRVGSWLAHHLPTVQDRPEWRNGEPSDSKRFDRSWFVGKHRRVYRPEPRRRPRDYVEIDGVDVTALVTITFEPFEGRSGEVLYPLRDVPASPSGDAPSGASGSPPDKERGGCG